MTISYLNTIILIQWIISINYVKNKYILNLEKKSKVNQIEPTWQC